jgi:hypothetical protein
MCFLRAEYIIGEVHQNNSVMKKNEKTESVPKLMGFGGGQEAR